MIDALFLVVDHFEVRIEEVEDALLARSSTPALLEEILCLKRHLVSLRKMLPAKAGPTACMGQRQLRPLFHKYRHLQLVGATEYG